MRLFCLILLIVVVIGCAEVINTDDETDEVTSKWVSPPPTNLSWSPDGDWILYLEQDSMRIMKTDGSGNAKMISGTGGYEEPVWSPDGQRVAYTYSAHGVPTDIWVNHAHEDRAAKRLTFDISSEELPFWSPDGRMIAYQSMHSGNWDIWLVNSDASDSPVQFTTHSEGDKAPAWSRDGTYIAFRSNRSGNYDIWVQAIGGGEPERITDSPGSDTKPKWSPDGRRIAYLSVRDGKVDIWVRYLEEDKREIQISTGGDVKAYNWSPSGNSIIYWNEDFILGRNSDGTGEEVVIDEGREPIWSPDGQKIAFVKFNGKKYAIEIITAPAGLN